MMMLIGLWMLGLGTTAHAEPVFVRWTGTQDANAQLDHVLSVLHQKTGVALTRSDLSFHDDRDLAYSHYTRLMQVYHGLPVRGLALRLWTDRITGALIQAEAEIQDPAEIDTQRKRLGRFLLDRKPTLKAILSTVRDAIRHTDLTDDRQAQGLSWQDEWVGAEPIRQVIARGRRGKHVVDVSLLTGWIVKHTYEEFPQQDIATQIFEIYERAEGTNEILPRVPGVLRHVSETVKRPDADLFEPLRWRRYTESQYDPILGESELGRAEGYWAMSYLKRQAQQLLLAVPSQENTFANGLLLSGKYATINLHPSAVAKYGTQLNFQPGYSAQFRPDWREVNEEDESFYEMVPSAARYGKPLVSAAEAMSRPARIDANQDPLTYLNDGFDEIQVYYAVNEMFERLAPMGFVDPDLAERPFHAFLFDLDVSMRDNAYYTDDTINFTTYSPGSQNMARDNPPLWHELGHGVMDRLMGDTLQLADTGGLSEGMADFVAQLVVQATTNGQPFPGSADFRIMNRTGFFLTNEVHDDGEAYGGAMNDLLEMAIQAHGRDGLRQVADLVLEAMRLSRDHPHLTAQDWFEHLLFADELGRPGVRAPGALHTIIIGALNGRNFSLDSNHHAEFRLLRADNGEVVTDRGPGSRNQPIKLELSSTETQAFELAMGTQNSPTYSFKYPVQVEVGLNGGPLQGGIRWAEETKAPLTFTLNSENDVVKVKLTATGVCDFANREDGSCVDFAYLKLINHGETEPVAKKRFYLRVAPQPL